MSDISIKPGDIFDPALLIERLADKTPLPDGTPFRIEKCYVNDKQRSDGGGYLKNMDIESLVVIRIGHEIFESADGARTGRDMVHAVSFRPNQVSLIGYAMEIIFPVVGLKTFSPVGHDLLTAAIDLSARRVAEALKAAFVTFEADNTYGNLRQVIVAQAFDYLDETSPPPPAKPSRMPPPLQQRGRGGPR